MSKGRQIAPDSNIFIKTFGYFNIMYNGESLFFGQNNAVKPLEIFKFLVVNIGKEISIETIVENIWPENDYYDEKTVVRTYIHRLRKIISSENRFGADFSEDLMIFVSKGRYRLEISDRVELDINKLTVLNNKITAVSAGEYDAEEVDRCAEELLEIYTGGFMADSPFNAWTIMFRNYYTRIFSTAVNHILQLYFTEGDHERVIEFCEASLKIYDLDENTNIIFLNALIKSGRAAVALQHYTYVTGKMYTELSVAPSEKMLEVYGRIKTDRSPLRATEKAFAKQYVTSADFNDGDRIIAIINELNDVAQKIMSGMDKYSVGCILLKNPNGSKVPHENGEQIREILEKSIRLSLRKNDMYAMFGPYNAVIILSDAQEEYYAIISKRLHEEFYRSYINLDLRLTIEISRVTTLR